MTDLGAATFIDALEDYHPAQLIRWLQRRVATLEVASPCPGCSPCRTRQPLEDYYAVLGIEPDASPGQVRHAFRREALRTHPDKSLGRGQERDPESFRRVARAYAVLGDPEERQKYDDERAAASLEAMRLARAMPPRTKVVLRRPADVAADVADDIQGVGAAVWGLGASVSSRLWSSPSSTDSHESSNGYFSKPPSASRLWSSDEDLFLEYQRSKVQSSHVPNVSKLSARCEGIKVHPSMAMSAQTLHQASSRPSTSSSAMVTNHMDFL